MSKGKDLGKGIGRALGKGLGNKCELFLRYPLRQVFRYSLR